MLCPTLSTRRSAAYAGTRAAPGRCLVCAGHGVEPVMATPQRRLRVFTDRHHAIEAPAGSTSVEGRAATSRRSCRKTFPPTPAQAAADRPAAAARWARAHAQRRLADAPGRDDAGAWASQDSRRGRRSALTSSTAKTTGRAPLRARGIRGRSHEAIPPRMAHRHGSSCWVPALPPSHSTRHHHRSVLRPIAVVSRYRHLLLAVLTRSPAFTVAATSFKVQHYISRCCRVEATRTPAEPWVEVRAMSMANPTAQGGG